MKGRIWLWGGAALGVAAALGRVPYLAGAGRQLAATAERLVLSGAGRVVDHLATSGAPRRVVIGIGGVLGVVVPGLTALLLVLAAVGTLRVRAIVSVLLVALGAASYAYLGKGPATGVLLLALAVAGIAVSATGPLVAAPLALGAGLLGAEYVPALVSRRTAVGRPSVDAVHTAIWNSPGHPFGLQVALMVVAAVPFALAARYLIRA